MRHLQAQSYVFCERMQPKTNLPRIQPEPAVISLFFFLLAARTRYSVVRWLDVIKGSGSRRSIGCRSLRYSTVVLGEYKMYSPLASI